MYKFWDKLADCTEGFDLNERKMVQRDWNGKREKRHTFKEK